MASLRSILNTPIGGRKSRDSAGNRMGPEKPEGEKKRRFSFGSSGRYPEKTTINLLYREPDENRKFTLILFGVFLIFLILFTKFLVIDQLQRVNRERIMQAAASLRLDTVYFLKGEAVDE